MLNVMHSQEFVPNEMSFGAALSACEKGSQWEAGLELLQRMFLEEVLTPDAISVNAAMGACDKGM